MTSTDVTAAAPAKPAKLPRDAGPAQPGPPAHRVARRRHPRADHAGRRLRHARGDGPGQRHPRRRVLLRCHRDGRRDGRRRLPRRRGRLPPGDDRQHPDHRALALRRGAPGRGRAVPARRGPDLPRDDAGVGQDPADLGGARPGRRWRGVRARPHRRRDPGTRGPDLRDRPRRGPLGDRRGRRHAAPRRPRAPRPALRRGAHPHRERGGGPRPGSHRRDAARLAGEPQGRRRRGPRPRRRCLPESKKRAYDVHPLVEGSSTRARPGAAPAVGAQHRDDPRSLRGSHRRGGRQQPVAAGRVPRLAVARRRRRGSSGCATPSACR